MLRLKNRELIGKYRSNMSDYVRKYILKKTLFSYMKKQYYVMFNQINAFRQKHTLKKTIEKLKRLKERRVNIKRNTEQVTQNRTCIEFILSLYEKRNLDKSSEGRRKHYNQYKQYYEFDRDYYREYKDIEFAKT